jgi:ectoine hydroxylase-related dioxygenase (phytanoyl-CoA dioxygenase family)
MLDGRSQGQPVPDEMLGPLVECAPPHHDPSALRQVFDAEGYVLLRGALDRDDVLAARNEVFTRLGTVGEIEPPFDRGIATGTSRRREQAASLGTFWKSVSEGPALRRVTHGPQLAALAAILFQDSARPHNYVFLRPAPIGNATDLHYDYPFFAGGASQIVTCWTPLGEIPICDGPLAIVEGSHRFDDLIGPLRTAALAADPNAFGAAQSAAYQATATDTIGFARSRRSRLLTAHFQPGDVVIFGGFTMHGSLDNHSPQRRVRLSVDIRYQPASAPADDPRYFGPEPIGAKGGGYGEQKAAQPLGTPWVHRQ